MVAGDDESGSSGHVAHAFLLGGICMLVCGFCTKLAAGVLSLTVLETNVPWPDLV